MVNKNEVHHLAYLGECYTLLELAKRNYKLHKMHNIGFDFLGQNNCKIEVKTAEPSISKDKRRKKEYSYKFWQFRLSTKLQQNCDFFVCVIVNEDKKNPLGAFVFPNNQITTLGRSNKIHIFESDISGSFKKINKLNRVQYYNNWDLITNFKEGHTSSPLQTGFNDETRKNIVKGMFGTLNLKRSTQDLMKEIDEG